MNNLSKEELRLAFITMNDSDFEVFYKTLEDKTSLEQRWKKLKDFIDSQCLFDNDTITYNELMEKIWKLEEN